MPKETITSTHVDNGDEQHDNVLSIAWGAKGGAPESPDGWVNAGFAHMGITREGEPLEDAHYVVLDPAHMDHLIRTLKKIRRQAFDAPRPA